MRRGFLRERARQYARSLPVRLVIAAFIIAVMFASGLVHEKELPAASAPVGQGEGLLNAYQDSTDTALRIMASQPPDKP